MKKNKKFLSILCAVCMLFALAAPASAASVAPEDDPYWSGVDWDLVDTSMCVPGTEYHYYDQNVAAPLAAASRNVQSGWVEGIPANNYPGTSSRLLVTGLTFNSDETGMVQVSITGIRNVSSVNISIYDKEIQAVTDYFTLDYNDTTLRTNSFYVDPTHEYNLYVSHNGAANTQCSVRMSVFVA